MKVRPAEERDIDSVLATGLREADVLECFRLFKYTPEQCLRFGFEHSDICFAAEADGEVFAIGGVATKSRLFPCGIPWLLGTDKLESVWYSFSKESRRVLRVLLSEYGALENFVDAENTRSIRWLEWLGFDVGETIMSPAGYPFKKFRRTNV